MGKPEATKKYNGKKVGAMINRDSMNPNIIPYHKSFTKPKGGDTMFYPELFTGTDIWKEFEQIHREMNRIFNRLTGLENPPYPPINMWTKDDVAIVTAELPGYASKDIHLTIRDGFLHIKGARKAVEPKEGEVFLRQERPQGEFERSIRLPFDVNSDKVEARFHDGILRITLPRAEKDMPKKIQIK